MSTVQRLHPTDPSRSANFNAFGDDAGRGAAGGGSDKLALLEAEQRGDDWRTLGLPSAPHYMEKDGAVRIQPKWKSVLQKAAHDLAAAARPASPAMPPPAAPAAPALPAPAAGGS